MTCHWIFCAPDARREWPLLTNICMRHTKCWHYVTYPGATSYLLHKLSICDCWFILKHMFWQLNSSAGFCSVHGCSKNIRSHGDDLCHACTKQWTRRVSLHVCHTLSETITKLCWCFQLVLQASLGLKWLKSFGLIISAREPVATSTQWEEINSLLVMLWIIRVVSHRENHERRCRWAGFINWRCSTSAGCRGCRTWLSWQPQWYDGRVAFLPFSATKWYHHTLSS